MYLHEVQLSDGTTRTVQHPSQTPTKNDISESLRRIGEGVAVHLIVRIITKGRAR